MTWVTGGAVPADLRVSRTGADMLFAMATGLAEDGGDWLGWGAYREAFRRWTHWKSGCDRFRCRTVATTRFDVLAEHARDQLGWYDGDAGEAAAALLSGFPTFMAAGRLDARTAAEGLTSLFLAVLLIFELAPPRSDVSASVVGVIADHWPVGLGSFVSPVTAGGLLVAGDWVGTPSGIG